MTGTFNVVTDAVTSSKQDAPLRAFTLGIGNSTSTDMCEGIARLGNGICLMAAASESIVGKTAKLLRASRTYPLTNITIDWGADLTASDDVTAQTDVFRQAPQRVPCVYAGNRSIVFALIKHAGFVVPDRVVLKAQQNGQGEVYSFEVPVEQLHITDAKETRLIHTLAARRIILELGDREKSEQDLATGVKETITHLGEQYQLASRYTSFVAVENRKPVQEDNAQESTGADDDFVIVEDQAWLTDKRPEMEQGIMVSCYMAPGSPLALGMPLPPDQPVLSSPPVTPNSFKAMKRKRGIKPRALAGSAASKLATPVLSQSPSLAAPGATASYGHVPALVAGSNSSVLLPPSGYSTDSYKLPGVDGDVVGLVRLQSFNGSFTVSPELEAIIGKNALAEGSKIGVDQTIWATMLAVAYLQKYLAHQTELLEGLIDKAQDFVSGTPGVNFAELLENAKLLIK